MERPRLSTSATPIRSRGGSSGSGSFSHAAIPAVPTDTAPAAHVDAAASSGGVRRLAAAFATQGERSSAEQTLRAARPRQASAAHVVETPRCEQSVGANTSSTTTPSPVLPRQAATPRRSRTALAAAACCSEEPSEPQEVPTASKQAPSLAMAWGDAGAALATRTVQRTAWLLTYWFCTAAFWMGAAFGAMLIVGVTLFALTLAMLTHEGDETLSSVEQAENEAPDERGQSLLQGARSLTRGQSLAAMARMSEARCELKRALAPHNADVVVAAAAAARAGALAAAGLRRAAREACPTALHFGAFWCSVLLELGRAAMRAGSAALGR